MMYDIMRAAQASKGAIIRELVSLVALLILVVLPFMLTINYGPVYFILVLIHFVEVFACMYLIIMSARHDVFIG